MRACTSTAPQINLMTSIANVDEVFFSGYFRLLEVSASYDTSRKRWNVNYILVDMKNYNKRSTQRPIFQLLQPIILDIAQLFFPFLDNALLPVLTDIINGYVGPVGICKVCRKMVCGVFLGISLLMALGDVCSDCLCHTTQLHVISSLAGDGGISELRRVPSENVAQKHESL